MTMKTFPDLDSLPSWSHFALVWPPLCSGRCPGLDRQVRYHPLAGREQDRQRIEDFQQALTLLGLCPHNLSLDYLWSLARHWSPIFKHTRLRCGAGRLARLFLQDQPTAPGGRRSLAQVAAITDEQRPAASVERRPTQRPILQPLRRAPPAC